MGRDKFLLYTFWHSFPMMSRPVRTGELTFRVINNTLAWIGGGVVYRILNLVTAVWIVRSLGREEYGRFSFVYVYLSFFEVFIQFGLNAILAREVSQNREVMGKILGNAILFRVLLCLLVLPAAFFGIRLLQYPVSVEQGVALAGFELFLTLRAVYAVIYRVRLKMIIPAAWNAARALLSLAFVILVIYLFRPSVNSFIVAHLASGAIAFAGLALASRGYVRLDFRPDWRLMGRLIKESAPLLASGYLTLIYYRVDVFMLSKMKGFQEVGYYSVATRITEALGLIATSLFVSLFPILARTFRENREHFEETVLKAFKVLLLFGFPVLLGGILTAEPLIVLLFGEKYAPSGITLSILLGFTFFLLQGSLLANVLTACGRQAVDAWISFFLVLANIALNFVLIPPFSYNGAALATVAVEILGVILFMAYAVSSPRIRMPFPAREFLTAFFVNLPFLGILLFLKNVLALPVFVLIPAAAFCYGVLLLAFGVFRRQQVQDYFSRWRRARAHD